LKWFNKLFKKAPKDTRFAPSFDAYSPIYSQFGTNIYASDVVQQALKCIVDEMKKLNPMHVRYKGTDPVPVKSTIQDALNEPNPLMTTCEFLEKVTWLLLLNYNVFIIPTYWTWEDEETDASGKVRKVERRYYEALYPINPTQVDFIEDASGKLFVTFRFRNGYTTTIAYDDVIHIRYNYSVSQYMGGNEMGQPNNEAILKTLELNANLLKGIAKAMQASYTVNGVIKYNTLMDTAKTDAAIKELERKLNASENGFLPLDLKADFTPLKREAKIIDADTLKFVDEKILRHWKVPLCILLGDYTKEQYEAYFQSALEPLIKCVSQAFTKKLFTKREKAYGNRIELYPEDLIFMTISQKIEMVNLLAPTGAILENEKRTIFGMIPLPELAGKRYMSLNWIDANDAKQYQVGLAKNKNTKIDIVDEESERSLDPFEHVKSFVTEEE
jgi:HK97 family phage portal protein